MGDLDALFSGKESWVINDDNSEEDDNVTRKDSKTIKDQTAKLKCNLKSKYHDEIMRAKGNLKKKSNSSIEKGKVSGENDIENKKNKYSKKDMRVNTISAKLKTISSEVRPIVTNNKDKYSKLSTIKSKCLIFPNNSISKKERTSQKNTVPKITSSSAESEEDSDNDSNKKLCNDKSNKNKIIKPSKVISHLVGNKKKNYADGLNKMLLKLKGKKMSNQYDQKDIRKLAKKTKKYLRAQARNKAKNLKKKSKNVNIIEKKKKKRRK